MLMSKIFILILSFLLTSSVACHNVIFDFNGVLMCTHTVVSLKTIALCNIIRYMVNLKKDPRTIDSHIKAKLFETLHNIEKEHSFEHNCELAYDEAGNVLPYLMRAWLDGSMSCSALRRYSLQTIEQHP